MKNTTKICLSKQGFKELKKKITKLEHEQKMLEMELRDGDVKEDLLRQNDIFARIDAIRSEINEKNFQIHNSKILPRSRKISSKVSIGSFVELFDRATGRIMKFRIVESLEANPLIGKILFFWFLSFRICLFIQLDYIIKIQNNKFKRFLRMIRYNNNVALL